MVSYTIIHFIHFKSLTNTDNLKITHDNAPIFPLLFPITHECVWYSNIQFGGISAILMGAIIYRSHAHLRNDNALSLSQMDGG